MTFHSLLLIFHGLLMISSIRYCRSLSLPCLFKRNHVSSTTTKTTTTTTTRHQMIGNNNDNSNNNKTNIAVVWFRDHALRIHDNLALVNAIHGKRYHRAPMLDNNNPRYDFTCQSSIVPVFLWEQKECGESMVLEKMGGWAKDVFVINALHSLNVTLDGNLSVGIVDATQHDDTATATARELTEICHRAHANEVYILKSHREQEDGMIEMKLRENGIVPVSFGGSFSLIDYIQHMVPWKDIVLEHPWRSPLIPFVEYVKRIMDEMPKQVLGVPTELDRYLVDLSRQELSSIVSKPCTINDLKAKVGRTMGGTNWGKSISKSWPATEEDAMKALSSFLDSLKDDQEIPVERDDDTVVVAKRTHLASRLSPYLARGLISPGQVYQSIKDLGDDNDVDSFLRRLCWRDYTYAAVQLYPKVLHGEPIRNGYEEVQHGIPMEDDERQRRFKCWKEGRTGFPLIDAGMRQLAKEGWMPQKVRLACSTFFVEGLGLSWKDGMQHFVDYLVDFDESINSNMWQNAGCVGLDPYYVGMNYKRRMYWDSSGDYVRRWCPELGKLPNSVEIDDAGKTSKVVDCLYEPWMSPTNVLEKAGVVLGKTYPNRVCNDRETRSMFFSRLRDMRSKWPATKIDAQKRDLVKLGSAVGSVGLFTPRALQVREAAYSANK